MNKTKGKRNTKKIGPIKSSTKTGKKGDSGSSTMNSWMWWPAKFALIITLVSSNLKIQNTFITGCSNFRLSAVVDHEKCKSHIAVVDILTAKSVTVDEIKQSTAGKALRKLKEADRARVSVLFWNAQAVIKNNKSLRDYVWLCQLDITKGIDIGETYLNSNRNFSVRQKIFRTDKTNQHVWPNVRQILWQFGTDWYSPILF